MAAAVLLGAAPAAAAGPGAPAPAPAAREAPRPLVAAVELLAPPGEDGAALRPLIMVEPGRALDGRAVRRTIQNLFGLGRFANVIVRSRPAEGAPGQVVVAVECVPKRVVASVRVDRRGRRGPLDEAALRLGAGLEPGQELWPGRLREVEARVAALLARRGYRRAQVRAVATGERQAAVELRIEDGPPTVVAAVALAPVPGLRAEALVEPLATHPGAVLDLDALEEDVRALRARLHAEGFLRARVAAPEVVVDGEQARVRIPLDPGPRFQFRFAGAAAYQPVELRDQLGIEAESILDAPAIETAARHLEGFYLSRGHAEARVTASEVATAGGVAVVFRVEEGRRYRVRSVTFTGAAHRSGPWLEERLAEAITAVAPAAPGGRREEAAQLAQAVRSPTVPRTPPTPEPREVWNPSVWDQAMARVVDRYRADGYLDAAHESTRAILDARLGTIDVEIRLREGVQTRVEAVEYEGPRGLAPSEVERQGRLAPGDPLAYEAVEATRSGILALYARRGYLYARVAESEEISPDRTRARVRFRIDAGPLVKVGRVMVSGARRTRDHVVRDAVALQPGDAYDPEAAARSQAALLRLGAFRSVALRLTDADVPDDEKDLTVEIAERPWLTLAPGAGFSLANGPRAFVEMVQPNLFGRALELSARVKVNYPIDTSIRPDLEGKTFFDRVEGRGDVGLRDPAVRLLGMVVGARVNAIAERLHRRAYDLSRGSAVFGLDLPASSRVTVQLQYELEVDHIQKSPALASLALTLADVERLRFPQGVTTVQSVRPVLVVDFRDDPLHPRSGWIASGTVDWAHSIGGAGEKYLLGLVPGSDVFTHMLKLSGALTGYLPLAAQSVLALSLRAGRVLPLEAGSQTIGPKRFFLGGASTMRGYGEDELVPQDAREAYLAQVRACASSVSGVACSVAAQQLAQGQGLVSEGGEAFLLAKAELRIPILASVEAGLFCDAGNLWIDPRQFSATELRFNVGVGLRFSSPIGPAVLDLGMNVTPDYRLGEHFFAPHFSIGLF